MLLRILVIAAVASICSVPAVSQEATEVQRYPATGNAILDCAPPAPAPRASCVLRMPPGFKRDTPRAEARGEGEPPAFQLLREGRAGFPNGVAMSTTLVLVDLSPGPNGGRRATFDYERALIGDFVSSLPRDEMVAIYGFNERLVLLQGFTRDRAALLDTVNSLDLAGTNTRIATFVGDAVSVLAERDDTILRNLVVISDGQEEGRQSVSEVVDAATESNIVISAVGMFWRPVGSAQTGSGMDFLRSLTQDTSGIAAQALLRRQQDAADAVAAFSRDVVDAVTSSGLIVPQGELRSATITLTLREPVVGAPGEFRPRDIEVAYLPNRSPTGENESLSAENETPSGEVEAESPPEADKIFGVPSIYVYSAAGVLALLFLIAIAAFVMRRGASADNEDEIGGQEEASGEDLPPTRAIERPQAYLVMADDNRRIAIDGPRVSVGRGGTNEVVIEDESISRLHAQIHRNRDGGFSVTDMDSLNGTYVNGDRIKGTMAVKPGDTVAFGKVSTRLTPA